MHIQQHRRPRSPSTYVTSRRKSAYCSQFWIALVLSVLAIVCGGMALYRLRSTSSAGSMNNQSTDIAPVPAAIASIVPQVTVMPKEAPTVYLKKFPSHQNPPQHHVGCFDNISISRSEAGSQPLHYKRRYPRLDSWNGRDPMTGNLFDKQFKDIDLTINEPLQTDEFRVTYKIASKHYVPVPSKLPFTVEDAVNLSDQAAASIVENLEGLHPLPLELICAYPDMSNHEIICLTVRKVATLHQQNIQTYPCHAYIQK